MSWAEPLSCSRVPRRWSACPRRRNPFFRNRQGYCCTNARVPSDCLSLPNSSATLSQCLPTAPLHCLSASRQLRYTVPVPPDSSATLSQCLPTAPLHCPSASRQLRYTVPVPPDSSSTLSQCLPTAPLHCPSASRQLRYTVPVPPDSSATLSQCLPTAPLHCLPVDVRLFYFPILLAAPGL